MPIGIIELITVSMATLGKALDLAKDKLPNYTQKKREKFFELQKSYMEETLKEYHLRDDAKVVYLIKELTIFMKTFQEEIENVQKSD